MAEEAISQILRRCKERTATILDDESFGVAITRGKLSHIFDIICKDKGCDKLVKICYRTISKKELSDILRFNDGQRNSSTILQLFFWGKNERHPFARPKLFYNQPNQRIPDDLTRLVK